MAAELVNQLVIFAKDRAYMKGRRYTIPEDYLAVAGHAFIRAQRAVNGEYKNKEPYVPPTGFPFNLVYSGNNP